MITKQPPTQKHVALANKTIEYWEDTHAFKVPADIKHDMLLDFSEALSQVESEALASKVVFPTFTESWEACLEKHHQKSARDLSMVAQGHDDTWKYLATTIKLAPNEPVISPDINKKEISNDIGFEEWFAKEPKIKSRESYSEWDKTIMKGAFQAGQASQVRLPEKMTNITNPHVVTSGSFIRGYNAAIDDMRKLNGLGE